MHYNVKDIEVYLKDFDPHYFTEEDMDEFIGGIDLNKVLNFGYASGATKGVIIPENKDYVIKVPFNGYMDYDEDGNFDFHWFYNGGGKEGWDYCELELEYYYDIIQGSEFEEFFLIPEVINCSTTDWPVYIQDKAELVEDECEGHVRFSSIESLYKVRTSSKVDVSLPETWKAVCLENLNGDIEKLDRFLNFLNDYFSDLHHGNIGYIGNHAVVVDFAGFSH